MITLLFHTRCLLLLFVLVQSVSLYRIYASNNHPDLLSSSFSGEMNSPIQNLNSEDEYKDTIDDWNSKEKRSGSSTRLQQLPQRRNNKAHWNPLVAAYKRCGELVARDERESCFKDAVQMLFVHKLRK